MREATNDLETVLLFCRAILNAESEEEVEQIKQGILDDLRAKGESEEFITYYSATLDNVVERFESGELIFNEDGQLVRNEEYVGESVSVPTPEPASVESFSTTSAGIALGLVASAIVVTMSVKRKIKKKVFQKK